MEVQRFPKIVRGTDFRVKVTVVTPVYDEAVITEFVPFNLHECTDLKCELICNKDQILIPLKIELDQEINNIFYADIQGSWLHCGSYSIQITGLDKNGKHWRYKQKTLFLIIDATADAKMEPSIMVDPLEVYSSVGLIVDISSDPIILTLDSKPTEDEVKEWINENKNIYLYWNGYIMYNLLNYWPINHQMTFGLLQYDDQQANTIQLELCTYDFNTQQWNYTENSFYTSDYINAWYYNKTEVYNKYEIDYNNRPYNEQYMSFIPKYDATFSYSQSGTGTLSYSLDLGQTWKTLDPNTQTEQVTAGQKILWKGNLIPSSSGTVTFKSNNNNFDAVGNSMSLIYGDNFLNKVTFGNISSVFIRLFYNSYILNAENLILPAVELTDSCYRQMFEGCTYLRTAPKLPATTMAPSAYYYMFYNCTRLVTAPELPATVLANFCYCNMFSGCTSLENVPDLPATTLRNSCYQGMFQNCTSLTKSPKLPAISLTNDCYKYMFNGCTRLNNIEALFLTTPSDSYTQNWVRGVAQTGTFIKNKDAEWDVVGNNGVPTGWTSTIPQDYVTPEDLEQALDDYYTKEHIDENYYDKEYIDDNYFTAEYMGEEYMDKWETINRTEALIINYGDYVNPNDTANAILWGKPIYVKPNDGHPILMTEYNISNDKLSYMKFQDHSIDNDIDNVETITWTNIEWSEQLNEDDRLVIEYGDTIDQTQLAIDIQSKQLFIHVDNQYLAPSYINVDNDKVTEIIFYQYIGPNSSNPENYDYKTYRYASRTWQPISTKNQSYDARPILQVGDNIDRSNIGSRLYNKIPVFLNTSNTYLPANYNFIIGNLTRADYFEFPYYTGVNYYVVYSWSIGQWNVQEDTIGGGGSGSNDDLDTLAQASIESASYLEGKIDQNTTHIENVNTELNTINTKIDNIENKVNDNIQEEDDVNSVIVQSLNDLNNRIDPGFIKVTNPNNSSKIGLVSSLADNYSSNIGNYATIEGDSDDTSILSPKLNTASGDYSHAEGCRTKASGKASHVEGYGSLASGRYSHAEGENAQAIGMSSHAEGSGTAIALSSHAEGNSTTAQGSASHAEGRETTAQGSYSHSEGLSTTSRNQSEHASGQYNVSTQTNNTFGDAGNTLFSVGNGTDASSRHNAFEIRQNGDIYIVKNGSDVKLQDELGGGSAGVTSFNGETGAVTYTAPVTSVNGMTGAVTIQAGNPVYEIIFEYQLDDRIGTTLYNTNGVFKFNLLVKNILTNEIVYNTYNVNDLTTAITYIRNTYNLRPRFYTDGYNGISEIAISSLNIYRETVTQCYYIKPSYFLNNSGKILTNGVLLRVTNNTNDELLQEYYVNILQPKTTKDLYNDSGYITSTTNGLKIEVVSALPATPDSNTIYIIQ